MFWENLERVEEPEGATQATETSLFGVLQGAIEALPDQIAILDATGRIVAVNQAWRQFGASNGLMDPNFCLGANYLTICDAATGAQCSEAPFVAAGLRALLREKRGAYRLPYPCHSEFEQRWFQIQAAPFQNAFRTYLIVTHQDISWLKQAGDEKTHLQHSLAEGTEALEQELNHNRRELNRMIQALRTTAYIIGHNLRAPLRAMHGFSTLLERSGSRMHPTDRSYTERIRSSAGRMETMLQGLLGYVRVAVGQYSMTLLDPNPLLHSVIEMLECEGTGAKSRVQIEQSLPHVWANSSLLELVFMNLLSNALKFTAPEAVRGVVVTCERHRGVIRFIIQDRGIGLPPELRRHLFGPLHTILAFSESGAGMGLLTAQHAVERMKARLGVESNPAQGSRFWIELAEKPPA